MPQSPSRSSAWAALLVLGACLPLESTGQTSVPPFRPVPPPVADASRDDGSPLRLTLVSEKANQITDEEAWWAGNDLPSPFLKVPNPLMNEAGNLPAAIPDRIDGDRRVVTASLAGGQPFAIYGVDFSLGDRVLLFDGELKGAVHALDFSAWIRPPFRIQWVQVAGDTLYLSYGINGYAKEAGGKTAFVAAYDLESLTLEWQSPPLVSNSRNFLIIGDSLVTGYGFTAEPDFLHVLDRHHGRVTQTVKVASGPEYLIEKDGQLFVRCYNRDYVFALSE